MTLNQPEFENNLNVSVTLDHRSHFFQTKSVFMSSIPQMHIYTYAQMQFLVDVIDYAADRRAAKKGD